MLPFFYFFFNIYSFLFASAIVEPLNEAVKNAFHHLNMKYYNISRHSTKYNTIIINITAAVLIKILLIIHPPCSLVFMIHGAAIRFSRGMGSRPAQPGFFLNKIPCSHDITVPTMEWETLEPMGCFRRHHHKN